MDSPEAIRRDVQRALRAEVFDPIHLKVLRGLTPAQRLKTAFGLYRTARRVKAGALRAQHPDWLEAQVQAEVSRTFLNART